MASSLVGTTTRARGLASAAGSAVSCSNGMPKASVFPVPVRACPMMALALDG